ncbi:MAG: hypothetical protein LBO00_09860 [Zoogloeaceae bacterium]|nr:hypothetical protein [Zoogloeaceae bacterium]
MTCRTRFTFRVTRALATVLLLGGFLGASAHAEDALSPEQALDLYLKTFVNADVKSAAALNAYLAPAYDGQAVNVERVGKMDEYMLEAMTEQFMQNGPGQTYPELKTPASNYFKAMQAALRRSECHATESTLEDNESVEDSRIAQVRFVCKIPDVQVDGAKLELSETSAKAAPQKLQEIKKYLPELTAQLNNAPPSKEIAHTFRLFETRIDGKSYWSNGSPGELMGAVMDDFLDSA